MTWETTLPLKMKAAIKPLHPELGIKEYPVIGISCAKGIFNKPEVHLLIKNLMDRNVYSPEEVVMRSTTGKIDAEGHDIYYGDLLDYRGELRDEGQHKEPYTVCWIEEDACCMAKNSKNWLHPSHFDKCVIVGDVLSQVEESA